MRLPVLIISATLTLCAGATAYAKSPKIEHTSGYTAKCISRDGKPVDSKIFGVHRLYPQTVKPIAKPPKGYKVVHLSHYGRHGARYIQYDTQYFFVHRVLEQAFKDGKLTPVGMELRNRYNGIYNKIEDHSGELCPLGQEQHRWIADRMMKNHPGLFRKDAKIVAISTNLERTMLSMWACLDQMHLNNPKLVIDADAPRTNMGYLNQHSIYNPWGTAFDQRWKGTKATWREKFHRQSAEWIDWKAFSTRIFGDAAYAASICNPVNFERDLYLIACDVPCMPLEDISFFDFFDSEELLTLAKCADNYLSYMEKGKSPECPGRCWALCHTLLKDFIDKADQDMQDGLGVRLRFGHDGCMMGLFVLMDLPGWNGTADNPDEIWEMWDCSQIPMASNLQLTLYKGSKSDPILMTWMLNEEPMPLPLEEVAPGFYRWDDFKAKYNKVIEESITVLEKTAWMQP